MNWYSRHIGDWLKKTSHLTLVQEGVYIRLVDWCYANERPLPLARAEVCNVARAHTPPERKAVEAVLGMYFEPREDGWHNPRVERELADYTATKPSSDLKRLHAKQRQLRSRRRRLLMFEHLRAKGIVAAFNVRMRELAELCETHGVTRDVERDLSVTAGVTDHGNHNPITNSTTEVVLASRVTAGPHAVDATRAGLVCKLMRKAGLSAVNPGDVRLHELLRLNVPDDEFRITATQASIQGKGFGWVLAAIKGRMLDAQRKPPERARSDAERSAEAWAPTLFANATEGR